jgi:membrane-bound ClpP family serine protease
MLPYFWPFLLLLLSLLLLISETLIPSAGILGILSALLLVGAIVAGFINLGAAGGTLFLLGCVGLAPVVFSLLVHYWPMTPIGKRILIKPPTEDEVLPPHIQTLKELMGRVGVSISPMLPSGAIRLDGKVLDAVSEGMPIDPGTPVEVIAVDGTHLVVRAVNSRPAVSPKPATSDVLTQPVDSIVSDPFDDPLS